LPDLETTLSEFLNLVGH